MTNQEQYEIMCEKANKYDKLAENIEQAIFLNHLILDVAKTCKNKKDGYCNDCILTKYDCPFPDLNYDLEKGVI